MGLLQGGVYANGFLREGETVDGDGFENGFQLREGVQVYHGALVVEAFDEAFRGLFHQELLRLVQHEVADLAGRDFRRNAASFNGNDFQLDGNRGGQSQDVQHEGDLRGVRITVVQSQALDLSFVADEAIELIIRCLKDHVYYLVGYQLFFVKIRIFRETSAEGLSLTVHDTTASGIPQAACPCHIPSGPR